MHRRMIILFMCLTLVIALPAAAGAQDSESPHLISAFFGLDNALPFGANGLCLGANQRDGMPVILSYEINPDTLDAADFAVVTESGAVNTPMCATLRPAVDTGELRTVLLIGELGSAESDPPVRVEVVGDILASGTDVQNFKGASVEVTPLSAGPGLVLAESVPLSQWTLDRASGRQQGDGCPSATTMQIVRVTWAGGVSNSSGDEAGEVERAQYRVMLREPDGSETEVTPFALADLGDGDNNHLLCLEERGQPVRVTFPAGYLLDPNRDTLNPAADLAVSGAVPAGQSYRNVRYCEVIPTYRAGLMLRTEVWNTLGLNDCPDALWTTLDAETLKDELGVLSVALNGPRYWVLDEIGALGGVTASGERASFGGLETALRGVLENRIGSSLVGREPYTANTIQRDTRYVFYSGDYVYTLTDPDGTVYVMQSYAQIIDPTLTIDDLVTLGERLALPEGWVYEAVMLNDDFILLSGGETTVVQDDLLNTYQKTTALLPR